MNGLEEVAIVVPFRLYITHYSPSPLCASEGANRPTIHIEGHAFTGSTTHLEGEIGGAGTRAMWGTVSTCAEYSMVHGTPYTATSAPAIRTEFSPHLTSAVFVDRGQPK